jgi:hypothetical protein
MLVFYFFQKRGFVVNKTNKNFAFIYKNKNDRYVSQKAYKKQKMFKIAYLFKEWFLPFFDIFLA